MRIAITDNHRPQRFFDYYISWIQQASPDAELIKLSYHLKNGHLANELDGLLLTGGGDVHPGLYGMEHLIDQTVEVNEHRDEFEFDVIERAIEAEIPVLGICRGMQIMNVYLGGSLVLDLQRAGFHNHTQSNEVENRYDVLLAEETLLQKVTGGEKFNVNSIHHQAVDRLGKGLMVSSRSPDGVTESAEWLLKDRMPFLLLVQWHPERMKDLQNPASGNIAHAYVEAVQNSMKEKA